jgi:hypothetical protein
MSTIRTKDGVDKGFPHGMPTTQADTINADLLAFLKDVTPRGWHFAADPCCPAPTS